MPRVLACRRASARSADPRLRMLQMVRTLAQFSISLEEMNEHGENAGDEGGDKDGGGEDTLDLFRNKRNGTTRVNVDGTGLCAGGPNGEVWLVLSLCHLRPPRWTASPVPPVLLHLSCCAASLSHRLHVSIIQLRPSDELRL